MQATALVAHTVATIVKHYAERAGLDPASFAGHRFPRLSRRGQTRQALADSRAHPVDRYSFGLPCAGFERLDHYLRAAGFPLPGRVAPVSVVPSAVPLAVPALGVMPDEKPVWGDAPAPGLLLALEALEFVRLAEPS
jgi:hypothetical protein